MASRQARSTTRGTTTRSQSLGTKTSLQSKLIKPVLQQMQQRHQWQKESSLGASLTRLTKSAARDKSNPLARTTTRGRSQLRQKDNRNMTKSVQSGAVKVSNRLKTSQNVSISALSMSEKQNILAEYHKLKQPNVSGNLLTVSRNDKTSSTLNQRSKSVTAIATSLSQKGITKPQQQIKQIDVGRAKDGLKALEDRYQKSLIDFKKKEMAKSQHQMDVQVRRINQLRQNKNHYETLNLSSGLGDMQKWLRSNLDSNKDDVDINNRLHLARTTKNLHSIIEKAPVFSPQKKEKNNSLLSKQQKELYSSLKQRGPSLQQFTSPTPAAKQKFEQLKMRSRSELRSSQQPRSPSPADGGGEEKGQDLSTLVSSLKELVGRVDRKFNNGGRPAMQRQQPSQRARRSKTMSQGGSVGKGLNKDLVGFVPSQRINSFNNYLQGVPNPSVDKVALKESLFSQTMPKRTQDLVVNQLESSFKSRRNRLLQREPGQRSDEYKLTPERIKQILSSKNVVDIYTQSTPPAPEPEPVQLLGTRERYSREPSRDEFTFYGGDDAVQLSQIILEQKRESPQKNNASSRIKKEVQITSRQRYEETPTPKNLKLIGQKQDITKTPIDEDSLGEDTMSDDDKPGKSRVKADLEKGRGNSKLKRLDKICHVKDCHRPAAAKTAACLFQVKQCCFSGKGGCGKPFCIEHRARDYKFTLPQICTNCKADYFKAQKTLSCRVTSIIAITVIILAAMIFIGLIYSTQQS